MSNIPLNLDSLEKHVISEFLLCYIEKARHDLLGYGNKRNRLLIYQEELNVNLTTWFCSFGCVLCFVIW